MWALPMIVAAVALVPIVVAVRRLAGEAHALRREIDRFSDLRPALLELRTEADALRRRQLRSIQRSRP
jgi:hypothetical protein